MFIVKKKRNYLRQIYKENKDTGAFIIEVSLDDYNEVFNGWDPSPIKRRDLDPDLLTFIDQCAFDIPSKYSLELLFYMPRQQYNTKKEKLTRIGIKNNFKFTLHFIRKELANYRKKILLYIILSFTFLISSYLTQKNVTLDLITSTLLEGMFIGGWVFLWEAFSLFFFSSQETYVKLRRYTRLLDAPIVFNYE
ncbi:hypothetical protein [Haloplasma contractile]|uniref:Uncharacterized protein n=1 Tax=Haloplasma contractile SSD-17B TaxID=1033810 RepID=U2EDV1_9MOLU|nr:hypothetical protein [Haloplasma contractile]ERJ13168.1 hypothetical protein HLPCO_000787 [Haloplasma contractile SSD-17B]